MPLALDIGRRVELVSMDGHCDDISIALYLRHVDGDPIGRVHTFSTKPAAPQRAAFVARAMRVLGGLERGPDGERDVRFRCGTWHASAAKRLFLEACKLDSAAEPEPRPLEVLHRATGQVIEVEALGGGSYRLLARDASPDESKAPAVANGLVKLGELERDDETSVSFPCLHEHDALVGLLLPRAVNVRAAIREEEAAAGRGVLVAPSAQASAQEVSYE